MKFKAAHGLASAGLRAGCGWRAQSSVRTRASARRSSSKPSFSFSTLAISMKSLRALEIP